MERLRDLRMVLIGGRELGGREASGKSSVGNIIMGREVFRTGRRTGCCQSAEGELHGRRITLVDTPGWWWHYSVENTPMFDRLEISQSLSLCPPGPHAFLLVIPVDSAFPDTYRMALEEHLEFFGEQIWKRMIVVFSSAAAFDISAFEKHLRHWPDLQWVLNKCQNRYGVLDVKNQGDGSQVDLLMSKIEKLVEVVNGDHFETVDKLSVQLHERRTRARKKAEDRILAIQKQRDELKPLLLDDSRLPGLRLVIVGASWAARSSAANAILGTNAFDVDEARTTVRCTVGQGERNGRELTVVDTPGWYYNSPLEKTSEMDKLEIQRSVTLCSPGPHAVLLTVPVATAFNKSYQKAVEEHMGLFGEDVWKYTVVLFTRGDWLGETSIEERIETEEPYLQRLMTKCENRYQVFTCKNYTDSAQAAELLQKIDETVAKNRGGHYESGNGELNEKLGAIQGRAKSNRKKVKRQRRVLQEVFKDKNQSLAKLRIVILGRERAGKSSAANAILFSNSFRVTSSEEFQHQNPTKKCTMHQRKMAECQVSVVDTPGWSASLDNVQQILRSASVCPPGPHAFLLVIPAHQPFTQKDRKDLVAVFQVFGEKIWRHTVLLFSHGDWLRGKPIEEYIECEGEALQWVVRKCDNRYHVLNDLNWGDGSQMKHLLKNIKETVVRNREEHFSPEEKKGPSFQEWLFAKTLTEAEWNKREDELIQTMLQALWLDLDEDDDSLPFRRRLGSFDIGFVPSLSGDDVSETASSFTDHASMSGTEKVLEWKRRQKNYAPSSGYDSESVATSLDELV